MIYQPKNPTLNFSSIMLPINIRRLFIIHTKSDELVNYSA